MIGVHQCTLRQGWDCCRTRCMCCNQNAGEGKKKAEVKRRLLKPNDREREQERTFPLLWRFRVCHAEKGANYRKGYMTRRDTTWHGMARFGSVMSGCQAAMKQEVSETPTSRGTACRC